jgi:hypothetical protein
MRLLSPPSPRLLLDHREVPLADASPSSPGQESWDLRDRINAELKRQDEAKQAAEETWHHAQQIEEQEAEWQQRYLSEVYPRLRDLAKEAVHAYQQASRKGVDLRLDWYNRRKGRHGGTELLYTGMLLWPIARRYAVTKFRHLDTSTSDYFYLWANADGALFDADSYCVQHGYQGRGKPSARDAKETSGGAYFFARDERKYRDERGIRQNRHPDPSTLTDDFLKEEIADFAVKWVSNPYLRSGPYDTLGW